MSDADPFGLRRKTVLVTGGSRGLGAAVVRRFAGAGARVVFCHLGDEERAAALSAEYGEVHGFGCDVTDEHRVEWFVRTARDLAGPADILITCAGIGEAVAFRDLTPETWDRMISVHMRGTFLVSRAVYPDMVARRSGRIIAVASQLAYTGDPALVHYCAAKAGILGFVRAFAREAAPHGVLVNAIAPGAIETDMLASHPAEWRRRKESAIPLGRFARVEEILPTVMLLASEAGSFYLGQTLAPTGGEVML